ncbi:hypothetical protein [Arthrobacter phage SWEP2]|nr:hypothetical protein [Arthrobacter phage SWEP2]
MDRAINALRRYYAAPESERTECLRETARSFVAARQHFFTREGEPDWLGRTYAYRSWVREVMGAANIPADDLPTIQSAIRYHTGNALREQLSEDEMDALGLKHSSPRERSVEKRERNSETLALFGGGSAITDADDVVRAAALVETFTRRIRLGDLDAADRRRVAAALEGMCARVADVVAEAKRRKRAAE